MLASRSPQRVTKSENALRACERSSTGSCNRPWTTIPTHSQSPWGLPGTGKTTVPERSPQTYAPLRFGSTASTPGRFSRAAVGK